MPKSTGLIKLEKLQELADIQYTADEQVSLQFYTRRCDEARNQREQSFREFDNLTYTQDYYLNKDAANSYLRPKINDDEVRVNEGTTEKKIEAVQNELLSFNLQPEVRAYDKEDNELVELGEDFTDIVKRTNEIEKDQDMWEEAVHEMLTQRAVFTEEVYIDKEVDDRTKSVKGKMLKKNGEFNENLARGKYRIRRAEKRLLSGLQVYLGNITIPAYKFNEQPYIVKYERLTYWEAATTYGDWDNWKYVKPGMRNESKQSSDPYLYRMNSLNDEECEIIHYYSYLDDEYMIIINGIMMMKPGTSLPWEYEGYNIKMTVLKSMSSFLAYGKPLTASAKTLQALSNEMLRNLVRKWRQSIEPPMGTTGSKVYSKDIWQAGAVTQGLDPDTFHILNADNKGITNSEFSMLEMIDKKTQEFIGAGDILQGQGEKTTATQATEQLRQAIKQLGLSVLAIIRMKRDMTFLRIYNELENSIEPIGKRVIDNGFQKQVVDVYKRYTINDAQFEDSTRGKKVVQFLDRDLEDEEKQEIFDLEEEETKKGNKIRFRTLNVKKLREIPLFFFVTVNQTQKEGSALDKIMFTDQIAQAQGISQITGVPLNGDKVIEEFERTWKSKDLFQKQAPVGMGAEQGVEGEGGEAGGQAQQILSGLDQLKNGVSESITAGAGQPQRPTVNTALGQAQ